MPPQIDRRRQRLAEPQRVVARAADAQLESLAQVLGLDGRLALLWCCQAIDLPLAQRLERAQQPLLEPPDFHPALGLSMIYQVRHITRYSYALSVATTHSELRLTPRELPEGCVTLTETLLSDSRILDRCADKCSSFNDQHYPPHSSLRV